MEDLRYPVGKFERPASVPHELRRELFRQIELAPSLMKQAVSGLSSDRLDTPYRPEGWTVRQVVHHLADSHMNAYVRLRLALTEDDPTIRPYNEAAWARLSDAQTAPVEISLLLLEALHDRWILLLRSLDAAAFTRTMRHPERGHMSLDDLVCLYAWHGRHHVAHVTSLCDRMGWR